MIEKRDNTIMIHTARSTYQMMVGRYGHLLHLYYGPRREDLAPLPELADRGFSGNPYEAENDRTYSLDALPQEFPTLGTGDFRSPLLILRDAEGVLGCDLRFVSAEIRPGKYGLPGFPAVYDDAGETLEVTLQSTKPSLTVRLYYGVLGELDVITRAAVVCAGEDLIVEKAQSACLDFTSGEYERMIFWGRHTMERVPDRGPVNHGNFSVESRRGMSSHHYNPFMILMDPDATEDSGRCWSMQFVYSGGFKAEIEKDSYGQTRMQMGLFQDQLAYPLKAGEELVLPEVIMSFSDCGLGRLSRNHHDVIRRHLCRGPWRDAVRPVLLNSWEACYFDFDGDKILSMARSAADLGVEMIVMDDGWFGERTDDIRGLGDLWYNEARMGCTLSELVDGVHDLGLKFGIWMEPEAISENSDLYREHPDWALAVPGRPPVRSRYQLLLDFSRDDVVDEMYRRICAVLDSGADYLKWDLNRSIADVYSSGDAVPGQVLYDYVKNLYRLLEQILERYPDLLIEGCAGGGGRFDAGMLYYCPQIWCSDNTDAVDRLTIQYGTSFGYPPCTMGAHVSVVPNHQTGRVTPFATRGAVAMAGTFGYELDPRKLSSEEKAAVREQIKCFHEDAPLVMDGEYYRLSDPLADPYSAWVFVARDGSRAKVTAVRTGGADDVRAADIAVKVRGLDVDAQYVIDETGAMLAGRTLMDSGLPLPPATEEYQCYVWHLKKAR